MTHPFRHHLAVASSTLASAMTGFRGSMVVKAAAQPAQALVLYDRESCPYCRLVREALSALHLDVAIRPCPKGGTRFVAEAERIAGKRQVPLLVDPNTGKTLLESRDIIAYLFETYGGRPVPRMYRAGPTHQLTSGLVTATRIGAGSRARRSRAPDAPLDLWSFESSPFARLVRERLCELELPYTLHNLGKEHWREIGPAARRIGSGPYVPHPGGKRAAFHAEHARVQVPYLEDPNTGARLFESRAIVDYLEATYAL